MLINDTFEKNKKTSIFFLLFLCIYLIYPFEALVRYVLGLINLGGLLYIKDLITVVLIVIFSLKSLDRTRSISLLNIIPIYILFLHIIIALFNGNTIFVALLGAKVYFGFIVGLLLCQVLRSNYQSFLYTIYFIWFFSCLGIFLNYFISDLPWIGYFDVNKAIGVGATSKVWATDNGARLSGFARASYNAAMIIGVSGLITLSTSKNTFKSIFIAIVSIYAIHLTTTKGMLLAFTAISIWYFCLKRSPISRLSLISIIIIFFLISLLMPLLIVLYGYSAFVDINHMPKILSSLGERFYIMWPSAFNNFSLVDWVFGRGVGSIGSAQLLLNSSITSYADNFFVYQYVTFGVFSIVYFSYIATRIIKLYIYKSNDYEWHALMLIIWFAYGITANMFEEQFFSTTLGVVFGFAMLETNNYKSYLK